MPRIPAILLATILAVLGLGTPHTALAQTPVAAIYSDSTTIPDTAACKRALEIADLINTFDETRARAYLADSLAPAFLAQIPLADQIETFSRVAHLSKKLEVYGVRTYDPPEPETHAVLIVRNTMLEAWRAIVVDVESEAPHRIAGLQFAMARPPSNLPAQSRLTDPQIVEQLDAYINRLVGDGSFSGTVLLAKDGQVLYTRAAGLANRDFDVSVTLDTRFNLGSMNKMMTAVAIMQLVEAGKLGLDDPISSS
ncbi:MAG: serine hydrolase [Phycisphaerales bacterium]|nr:serine hydrolase [Phycisphaerales bacterium]